MQSNGWHARLSRMIVARLNSLPKSLIATTLHIEATILALWLLLLLILLLLLRRLLETILLGLVVHIISLLLSVVLLLAIGWFLVTCPPTVVVLLLLILLLPIAATLSLIIYTASVIAPALTLRLLLLRAECLLWLALLLLAIALVSVKSVNWLIWTAKNVELLMATGLVRNFDWSRHILTLLIPVLLAPLALLLMLLLLGLVAASAAPIAKLWLVLLLRESLQVLWRIWILLLIIGLFVCIETLDGCFSTVSWHRITSPAQRELTITTYIDTISIKVRERVVVPGMWWTLTEVLLPSAYWY